MLTSVVGLTRFLDSTCREYSLDIKSFNSLKDAALLTLFPVADFGHPEPRRLFGELFKLPRGLQARTAAVIERKRKEENE